MATRPTRPARPDHGPGDADPVEGPAGPLDHDDAAADPDSPVGRRLEVEVGPIAHGGHFVARHEGQVVFVRHTLPGERVVVEVTEDSGKFLRADAVEVLQASPARVEPPCPYAGPGACGGCDFQHVDLAEQRLLKAAVVREQLSRLAGLERDVVVEPVGSGPGADVDGLRWRSRMQYVALPDDQHGLRVHRSHDVVAVEDCLIAAPDARQPAPGTVTESVTTAHGTRTFQVAGDGFWQPHVDAPRVLVDAVLDVLAPAAGESVLDLYAGVGLFAAFLGEAVGRSGSVLAVEGDRAASELSEHNLADLPWTRSLAGRVDRVLHHGLPGVGIDGVDLVVLDPPRVGAKRQVVRQVAALSPRAVAYVACDPAALARDVAYFAEQGYRLASLRSFDLFPMTQHVECVALLVPS
ncbi:MAG: SAM-dependent methyltransferase [Marmoricola sp.]|nr:SAM-dependent methyltransferase [Marmoricola sp.]